MFPQTVSTTLENIQRILGKKFIDIILGVAVLSVLTSVCYYLGFFRALGINVSDINMNIFELLDIEILVIIGIIYAVAYDRELLPSEKKYSTAYHDGDLSMKYKIKGVAVVAALFLLMILALYQGPYNSDMVFAYLINNLSLFFFPSIITGFLMWCIMSFHRRSIIEFAIIFCAISIVSYTTGMYHSQEMVLSGVQNNHTVLLSKWMCC